VVISQKGSLLRFRPFQYSSPVFQSSSPVHRFQTALNVAVKVALNDQMGSGCGAFATSSLLEGDIDYSHRPR